jgi:benzoate-CoA ligase
MMMRLTRLGSDLRPKRSAGLKAFVKDRLAPYKYTRFIEFVAELPETATGKIQRFKLRAPEQQRG